MTVSPTAIRLLASGSRADSVVQIWSTTTGDLTRSLSWYSGIYALVALPGDIVASGSPDNTVRLWEVRDQDARRRRCRCRVAMPRTRRKEYGPEEASSTLLMKSVVVGSATRRSPHRVEAWR